AGPMPPPTPSATTSPNGNWVICATAGTPPAAFASEKWAIPPIPPTVRRSYCGSYRGTWRTRVTDVTSTRRVPRYTDSLPNKEAFDVGSPSTGHTADYLGSDTRDPPQPAQVRGGDARDRHGGDAPAGPRRFHAGRGERGPDRAECGHLEA